DLVELGAVYETLSDIPRATATYRRAAQRDRRSLEAHQALATILLNQNDPRAAALSLRVAIAALPDSDALFGLLASAAEQSGQLGEAVRYATHAVRLGSREIAVHGILARAHDKRGEDEACVAELRTIAALVPDDFAAHAALGVKLSRTGAKTE